MFRASGSGEDGLHAGVRNRSDDRGFPSELYMIVDITMRLFLAELQTGNRALVRAAILGPVLHVLHTTRCRSVST
jgi:hypothetical protein